MSASTGWRKFTLENLNKLPSDMGAYEMADKNKKIVYIGGSNARGGCKSRLLSHLRNKHCPEAVYFKCFFVLPFSDGIDMESRLMGEYVKKHGKKPKCSERTPNPKISREFTIW